ncbi:MAG: hypothetical protein ACKO7B_17675, partial [Flavobacteriales bacterium]
SNGAANTSEQERAAAHPQPEIPSESTEVTLEQGVSAARPQPPALGKRNLILQSAESVSIKNVITKQSQQQQQVAVQQEEIAAEQPTREYTTDELRDAWSRFADEKISHNMQAQSAFKVAEVELKLGNTLRIALPSATQEMYFNEYRNQLAEFLRTQFDIRGIDFKVEIMRPDEIKSTYQSAKQRFDTLVALNPALDELRKRF